MKRRGFGRVAASIVATAAMVGVRGWECVWVMLVKLKRMPTAVFA